MVSGEYGKPISGVSGKVGEWESAASLFVADATNVGAEGTELFHDVLVAAVDVIDAVDGGFAPGDQRGEHQPGRRTQVRWPASSKT